MSNLETRRARSPRTSDLLADFHEFYAEVLRFRAEIIAASATNGPMREALPSGLAPDAEIIARHLQTLLSRQLARGGDTEATYAMVALADDIFLHESNWPGHNTWRDLLLEYRMFQSHMAGEEIFTRIDRLLEARRTSQVEMGQVYLLVLQQGFRGGLRNAMNSSVLLDYSKRLYAFVYHRTPDLYHNADDQDGYDQEGRVAFPQALAHTLSGQPIAPYRFGGHAAWIAVGGAAFILVTQQLAWMTATSGLVAAASGLP
jgi:type VI secretion system protein ImpK